MSFKPTKAGVPHSLTLPAGKQMTVLTVLSVLLALAARPAQAATRYWDGGTVDIAANGDGTSDGASGTWSTTVKNWDQGSGLAHVAWVNGGNTAEINGASQTLALGSNITLGGIVQESGGTSVIITGGSGPYTLTLSTTGANTFLAAANATTGRNLTVNAVIAGSASKNLVLAGPATSDIGTINLGGANTYSGTTTFSAGATGGARVYLRNPLAFQNSTVTLSSDANLIFDDSVSADAFTIGGLAANSAGTGSNLALRNETSSPIALTVGGNNQSTTYKGVLSAGGSLIKTGTGILTLTAANTYTGTTTVSSGTLRVDGSTTSPTTVNSGATLAGDGTVNASVTLNAGASLAPGSANLTVSNLTFIGTGTVHVGTLSSFTSTAAVKVNSALTLSGGAGAVTLNLSTAPGFNGIYHLIQFGSGPATTTGFSLGTVPTLAWNQTGTLQVNGNYLDYVITGTGDTTPPTLANTLPANNAANVPADADLVATFDETILPGTGSIELRRSSDASLVESFNVASSLRLAFNTAQLIIQPTNVLPAGQGYYILIPAGAIKDSSGNSYAGITGNTGWKFTVPVPAVLYTDTGSPANPPWSEILPTLNVDAPDNDPVLGSLINVNNAVVETGLYGNRPISAGSLRIHIACNTSTSAFEDFTRWFQTDGNTHVLRVFVDDENTATSRTGTSSHTEAFMAGGWNYTDNRTYEWTARYTIARHAQSYSCFQLKNTDNDWAVSLGMNSDGSLTVNNRSGTDKILTNPDGSRKIFSGGGFDIRVLDDGLNYKLWVDGVLHADGSYSRPTGSTTFRWGMYFGANNLNPPSDYNLVLVSGAQVKSWPGNLDTVTTTITKANNTTNLNSGGSWTGGATPGLYQQALWTSTVSAANTAATLASYQQWAGLKIEDPAGNVTLNGSATLGLETAGVDLTAATWDLTVNCPVQMTAPSIWRVALGRKATFNGVISGYPGLVVSSLGTLQLEAANTYSGGTTVNGGTLVANDNSALGTGRLVFNGGSLSNTSGCTLGNDVSLNSNASVDVDAPQTLTLYGSIAGTGSLTKTGSGTLNLSGTNVYTGATVVSAGTLAVGSTSALLATPGLMLAGGTVLQPRLDGVVVRSPVTVGGSGTTATISAPVNAPGGGVVSTLTLRSVLAGSGNVAFSSSVNQNALSTVYLAAQNTYAGSTLLDTAGTSATQVILKLGIHNALPPSTVLTIDGQPGTGTGRYAELNLNGFNQQLAGLTNTARSLRIQRVVNSNVSPAATLTVHNSGSHTFSGSLGGTAGGSVSGSAMPGTANGNNFGLSKSGTGTFTLTGPNSYAGNTTVTGGTLGIGTINPGNESSTVTLVSPGIVTLAYAGTDTVARLFIGNIQQPAGTYGHGSTGATNGGQGTGTLDAYFGPGTGTLTVTSGPAAGFSTWITGTFANGTVPAGQQGPDDDADSDGIRNLLEYALAGEDPTVAHATVGNFNGSTLSFTKRPGTSGLAYAIQESTDLGTGDPWAEVTGASYGNTAATISYTFTPGTPVRQFLRLQVLAE